jgi:sugar lactone lactonase YvrE
VFPDRDGVSIWVAERCSANNCAASDLHPVLKFDSTGTLVRSFGAGLLVSPHGIWVDAEGNVWIADCACTGGGGRGRAGRAGARGGDTAGRAAGAAAAPAAPVKGHQIFKFSPTGDLLMRLGTAGGANAPSYFFQPNDVLVAPNGDIFVSEGHGQGGDRILKFSKDGTLIKSWGKRGTGRGEFNQPHALAMDSRGRLFVGDRSNNRIQIFDQDGNFLDEWYQFSRPSGIFIDAQDNIYVADSESGSVNPAHVAWQRGIRIGKATDGSITAFIPDPAVNPPSTSAAEGVAVDKNGVIYGAEVGPRALKRYARR